MGWKDELLEASFRGVKFDCVRTDDSAEVDLARNAYPYVDGEDVEDLGQGARQIRVGAVFFGDDYKVRLDALLAALAVRRGELIHPVFGSIKNAQVVNWSVGHDAESPDSCMVDVQLVEATTGNPFFVQQLPNQKADAAVLATESASSQGTELFAKAMDGLRFLKGQYGRLNALRSMLNGTLGPLYNLVTGFTRTTLDVLNFPRAFTSDLVGLLRGMGDLRSFDTGVLFSDWKGLTGQFRDVVQLPSQAGSGQSDGRTSAVATPSDVALVTGVVQLVVATELAAIAVDILASETETPTLSQVEIEQIADDTRQAIADAIQSYRDQYAPDAASSSTVDAAGVYHTQYTLEVARPVIELLKDIALAVQTVALEAMEVRPPVELRTVELGGNLALIAHRWYGDHARSAELMRLNPALRNPNFVARGEVLRAYAR